MAGTVSCSEIAADWKPFKGVPPDNNAMHVWHASVVGLLNHKEQLKALLINGERQTAARYKQERHQHRYIIQHGLLRLLLAWYTGRQTYSSAFVFNANKKPYLTDNACYFNISHTEGHLLISIGRVEVGVDIEYINPQFAYQDIVSHYFNLAEQQFIAAAKNPQQAFFLLWTRKEALLKSSGLGIDDNLPLIPALDGTSALPPQFGANHWQTQTFITGQNIASITHPRGTRDLKFWTVEDLNETFVFA